MHVIQTPQGWKDYQQALQDSLRPDVQIGDTTPKAYPCLVFTAQTGRNIRHCFVYVSDARKLLQLEESLPQKSSCDPTQDDFNKHITALIMAVIEELNSVSITKPERFEQLVVKNLARVDQCQAGQLDPFCSDTGSSILRELYSPTKDE